MSDVPIHGGSTTGQSAFSARTMLLITAIGALAFIAMLILGAYAPDLRSGRNGGTHALSNGATGFSGLVRLAQATGRHPVIVRSVSELKNEDLAVVTPDHGWINLADVLGARGPRTTLVVMPKWDTTGDPAKSGWVRVSGLVPAGDPEGTLAPGVPLKITRMRSNGEPLRTIPDFASPELRFLAPRVIQTMSGRGLKPLITDGKGRVVLAQVEGRQLYLLSDPDLLNNHGMGDERQARAALALLDFLNSTDATAILFDVTVSGLGHSKSPLKLAFDPPFLGVTLTIFAAMLLAAWQALVRFGPARHPRRAIAFGKAALVDNSAALIRKAGRESHLGSRYVGTIRERAVRLFRLPPTLDAEALDGRLETLNPRRSFASAARAAKRAGSRDELLGAAKSLHQWLEEAQQ
jgi:hypothetical protein